MTHTDDILRTLSIQEASFPIYAQLSAGAGNVLAGVTLATELTPGQVQSAMMRLHGSQALLRASYVYRPAEKTYAFVEVKDEAPVLEYEQLPSIDAFTSAVKAARVRLINRGFIPGKLLYRAMLLTAPGRSFLMVCASHAVTDAGAVENILRGWLEGIAKNDNASPASMPMPPSLFTFMPPTISAPSGVLRSLGVLMGLLGFQKRADRGQAFRVERPAAAHEHRCIVVNRRLSQATTQALLQRLKANNVNLHGYLGAAYLLAFLEDCRQRDALIAKAGELEVPLVTTVNVRRHTPEIGARTLGCFSSGVTRPVKMPVTALNDTTAAAQMLSQGIADDVKDALAAHEHWKILRIYPLFGYRGLRKMFLDTSEKPMGTPISFANGGMIDLADIALPIRHYEFYASFHVSGPALSVTANTCNGVMTLGFTGPAPLMSQATIETYADRVLKVLQVEADDAD